MEIKEKTKVKVPNIGNKIYMDENGKLVVPNNPIIPFIEGDGIGGDIWKTSVRVFDAAVEKAYDKTKKINWMEIYAGEKANSVYGSNVWLPEETIDFINDYLGNLFFFKNFSISDFFLLLITNFLLTIKRINFTLYESKSNSSFNLFNIYSLRFSYNSKRLE